MRSKKSSAAAWHVALRLDQPDLDWCSIARGMGVPAIRAETAEELTAALAVARREPGPHVIVAMMAEG